MAEFVVTDGNPVQRWFGKLLVPASGYTGERLSAGQMPFLIDHDDRKLGGRVTEYRIEGDKLIMTVPDNMRSNSTEAGNVWPDIDSGVRPGVSPEVMVDELAILSEVDDPETIVSATVWDSGELSSVTMPANVAAHKMSVNGGESGEGVHFIPRIRYSLKAQEQLHTLLRTKLSLNFVEFQQKLSEGEGMVETLAREQPETTIKESTEMLQADVIALVELAQEYGYPELGIEFAKAGKSREQLLEALLAKQREAMAEDKDTKDKKDKKDDDDKDKMSKQNAGAQAQAQGADGQQALSVVQTVQDVQNILKFGREHNLGDMAHEAIISGQTESQFRDKAGTIVLQDRRVTMTQGEREKELIQGTPFSFDKLAVHMLHPGEKERELGARYELDFVKNHDVSARSSGQNTVVIPDEVVNMMMMSPALRERLAITTSGAASAIATSVDYARSQMALYDRLPLMQYCDVMPNQVGDAKIPIWNAGPRPGESGDVQGVTVTAGGAGYTAAPAVSFARGAGDTTGTGAAAVAVISGGVVVMVVITDGGRGYTVPPTVTIVGAATGVAVLKSEGDQTALSTPTLTALTLTPKAFDTQVRITEIANLETGRWLTDAVRMHMIPALDDKIMEALLSDPVDGILSIPGLETVATGALSWSKIVDMEVAILQNRAMDYGRRAYVCETSAWGSMKTTDKSAGAGRFIIDSEPSIFNLGMPTGMMNNYPVLQTTLLGSNNVLFTDWYGNMKVPMWSGYEFSLDNITNPLQPRLTMYKFCRPKATTGRGMTVARYVIS